MGEIIGDAYFLVGGCDDTSKNFSDNAKRVVDTALQFMDTIPKLREIANYPIAIRIGIHTGPAVAGVVGKKDPRYHVFGKSVDLAQKMEQHSIEGRVNCSATTYQAVTAQDEQSLYTFEDRGEIETEGHGMQRAYFLQGCSGPVGVQQVDEIRDVTFETSEAPVRTESGSVRSLKFIAKNVKHLLSAAGGLMSAKGKNKVGSPAKLPPLTRIPEPAQPTGTNAASAANAATAATAANEANAAASSQQQ